MYSLELILNKRNLSYMLDKDVVEIVKVENDKIAYKFYAKSIKNFVIKKVNIKYLLLIYKECIEELLSEQKLFAQASNNKIIVR